MIKKTIVLLCFCSTIFLSCKEEVLPKPTSLLRLEYAAHNYITLTNGGLFQFEVNKTDTKIIIDKPESIRIVYPKMKATIYINYKPVANNIKILLSDAQKLTYEHVIKADDILEQPFINADKKVYGMFYEVGGDAATNVQFYATDSLKNFVVGSAYFYAKPNFDSIYPAANYLKNDMQKIMETLEWKK